MYITDKFVFVEVPKTGSTYIDQVMVDMLDGQKTGKHNYPGPDLLSSQRSFVGSIRNPFDWYVSLWAYGCKVKHRSGPYRKTISYRPFDVKGYGFDKNLGFGIKAYLRYVTRAPFADRTAWKDVYADHTKSDRFGTWVDLMFNRSNVHLYNGIFAQTPLRAFIGLYTFRYLWLCCRNREELLDDRCPRTLEDLQAWERRNCYVDRFIRMENMAPDLLSVFEDFGYALRPAQRDEILNRKRHNASDRNRSLAPYYSPERQAVVADRDRLVFEKFGYNDRLID